MLGVCLICVTNSCHVINTLVCLKLCFIDIRHQLKFQTTAKKIQTSEEVGWISASLIFWSSGCNEAEQNEDRRQNCRGQRSYKKTLLLWLVQSYNLSDLISSRYISVVTLLMALIDLKVFVYWVTSLYPKMPRTIRQAFITSPHCTSHIASDRLIQPPVRKVFLSAEGGKLLCSHLESQFGHLDLPAGVRTSLLLWSQSGSSIRPT